jgi:predicted enzyme related to lactoylglutathione lyase
MNEHTSPPPPAGAVSTESVYGAPCWVSLMARDMRAAQEFYGAVLGWSFRPALWGEDFAVAHWHGCPVAGIGALAPALQIAVAWTPYFAVRDVDETAGRIRERTGTIAVGPLPLSTGRGALAADRDGAVFGIWEGQLHDTWQAWRTHARVWIGLQTQDAFAAAIFYGEVLGWAGDGSGCCEVEYVDDEVVLRSAGRAVARLWSGAQEASPNPLARPHWQVHFLVDDVETCVAAAGEHGGTVVARRPTPSGGEATLRDPDGGLFTIDAR